MAEILRLSKTTIPYADANYIGSVATTAFGQEELGTLVHNNYRNWSDRVTGFRRAGGLHPIGPPIFRGSESCGIEQPTLQRARTCCPGLSQIPNPAFDLIHGFRPRCSVSAIHAMEAEFQEPLAVTDFENPGLGE